MGTLFQNFTMVEKPFQHGRPWDLPITPRGSGDGGGREMERALRVPAASRRMGRDPSQALRSGRPQRWQWNLPPPVIAGLGEKTSNQMDKDRTSQWRSIATFNEFHGNLIVRITIRLHKPKIPPPHQVTGGFLFLRDAGKSNRSRREFQESCPRWPWRRC